MQSKKHMNRVKVNILKKGGETLYCGSYAFPEIDLTNHSDPLLAMQWHTQNRQNARRLNLLCGIVLVHLITQFGLNQEPEALLK